ncbi:glycosyltransferase [Aeromicrobium phragmitis]|uniref:Glycosyltransferase n=1 Tax=Aeromicrobium phragmitis TaxID=2478914 RepID=A0A3L8PK68_9ACTN|nr:glycosyltransferase [Aeromicrobium phragmitis]RLV54988.1 glycosyltransferase [Aeromicrobium phragmitis]
MRIAQLASFIGPLSGGMKTAVAAIGRGYVEAGAERLLVVPGPRDRRFATEAGDVVQLRAPRVGGGYRLLAEPWRVADLIDDFAPTSVEVNDKSTLVPAGWWARRRGVGSVLFSHERLDHMLPMRLGGEPGTRVPLQWWNRTITRGFDAVVVTSRFAQAEFRSVPATDAILHRVPLGVDLATFTPPVRRQSAPVLRLVHAGRLSREKSPALAVATAVELHNRGIPVRLDVFGEGPQRDELMQAAGEAPIVFHGHVADRRVLAARLGEADVALSVCPGETFGLAVLEALACGTPVVTADRGGARELVCSRSGQWAAPHPRDLADAVLALAARPVEATRRAARERAEQFPWAATVDRMLEVHASVSGRTSVPA